MSSILPPSFYQQETKVVAQQLLGQRLVRIHKGNRLSGIIVETEAYLGIKDAACHSFADRRTARTESLYRNGGSVYVYLIYGFHFLFNIVTKSPDFPEAVLIRALQPDEGVEQMKELRRIKSTSKASLIKIANGPGKLTKALNIDKSFDQSQIFSDSLFVERVRRPNASISFIASPRIGVAYAGEAAKWNLRFSLRYNDFVSKPYPWK